MTTPTIANVLDYGATQNGDITAALVAIRDSTNLNAFVGAGSWTCDPVALTRSMKVKGAGRGITIIRPATTSGPSNDSVGARIFSMQANNCVVRDMTLIGTIPPNSTPELNSYLFKSQADVYPACWIECPAVDNYTGRSGCRVICVEFSGGVMAIDGMLCDDFRVQDCDAADCWVYGFVFGSAKNIRVVRGSVRRTRWSEGLTFGNASSSAWAWRNYAGDGLVLENNGYLAGQENFDLNCVSQSDINIRGITFIADVEWVNYSIVATQTDNTHFVVTGNFSSAEPTGGPWRYLAGARVKLVDGRGFPIVCYVTASSYDNATNTTTVTISQDPRVAPVVLQGPLQSFNECVGGGIEIKTDFWQFAFGGSPLPLGPGEQPPQPTADYDWWQRGVISGCIFKLRGAKHCVNLIVRTSANKDKGRRVLFTGNGCWYDRDVNYVPTRYTAAIVVDSWSDLTVSGNVFDGAWACMQIDGNTDGSFFNEFIGNDVRDCRMMIYAHDDNIEVDVAHNKGRVLDQIVYSSTSGEFSMRYMHNDVVQEPDGWSQYSPLVDAAIYLDNADTIAIEHNTIDANQNTIVIGAGGSTGPKYCSIRANHLRKGVGGLNGFVAIYKGSSFDLDNDCELQGAAVDDRGYIVPSGSPTNIRSRQRRGTATAVPTDGGALGDYYENSAPTAGGVDRWVCTTAGAGGAAVWRAVALA